MHFLISGVATANQAGLQQKLDSFYFLNERCFSLFILEVDLCYRSKTFNVCLLFLDLKLDTKDCLLFLDLKLDTKESTGNEGIHLHIFIKFIKKIIEKKVKLEMRKN